MSSIYGNIVALQPLDWWLEVIRIQLLLDISAAMIYKQCTYDASQRICFSPFSSLFHVLVQSAKSDIFQTFLALTSAICNLI